MAATARMCGDDLSLKKDEVQPKGKRKEK